MNPEVIGVFIPIVGMLVTGVVLVTFFYFRSREKQMLIDKGMTTQEMKEFYESKKSDFGLLKTGIIIVAFGFALGFGLLLEDTTSKEYFVPMSIFTLTGAGFIVANLVGNKLQKKKDDERKSLS